ncbi:thiamine-phosphate kinase [Brachybacterium alimentarium]|uniref:Thiamine-monophosphate kinase n=1 Tax=Brachybacterium alimentarium TaxID=47845 RepID=A0A2A3YI35_9MICO|nr:thiamine-phosphate kinase [Brachybacterium alimentarium]PCC32785.1 thiamine-phosphate kinase [Brachybacterium alimentarium]PCC38954.1 thiamine-phosphate kinase [Brachybacterium alimentarium]RCS71998.1 thiamine-phosphate kinase [Brachybacterium alimentarium]RCS77538.1 thiamine-phosphate kinase [Brachybacterium alimentarium]RCS86734.1 thiamine-phosphate kinase [Brachybacterium alimentarium]
MTGDTHLGEAGLLARMLPHLSTDPRVEVGPGDDAAVVRLPSPRMVVTTDTLVQGHDFLFRTTMPRWIGHKAAVQNLADVAAMGARPVALVVALSAPHRTEASVFEEITIGIARRAEADGARVVGGDLGSAEQLTLTVTALGALPEDQEPVLRSGARAGDVLTIGSPQLGRSAAGLALVLSGRIHVHEGRIEGAGDHADLVAWHDAPEPDLALGWGAGRGATSMMDLSDGLVRDGTRIARASGVVLDLDRAVLSSDASSLMPLAELLGEDPWQWVLHGGEEHAMLATFPPEAVPEGFRAIGQVRDAAGETDHGVLLDGAQIPGTGFDHFEGKA